MLRSIVIGLFCLFELFPADAIVRAQEIALIDTVGFDSLLAKMYSDNIDLQKQLENVKIEKEKLFQSKMSFLRNLKLGFQFYQANTTNTLDEYHFVPRFGLNIQLDFESIFTSPSKIKEARSELHKAEFDLEASKDQLKLELLKKYMTFKKSIQLYQNELERYRTIHELHQIANQQFSNGEISFEEFSNSILNDSKALENLLSAEYELKLTRAELVSLIEN